MKICFFTLSLLINAATVFAQQDTLFYSVVNKGRITGAQKVWHAGPNEFHYSYYFNDRGRGDSTHTTVITNAQGLIVSQQSTGVDYYKNPFSENFSIAGDSAVWIINGEKKSVPFNNQLYAAGGAPAIIELLVAWASSKQGKQLAVLPDGFMHTEAPLLKTISLNGKALQLQLFKLYFDPNPVPLYVWLTSDNHFFATVSSWTSNIMKGYEALPDSLLALQELAGQDYYEKEISNYSTALAPHLLLTHVNVFQSADATVLKDRTVEIRFGKIINIRKSVATENAAGTTTINCNGKFLMPGLWDMHGHYQKDEGPMYLAGGITHIRDMGNDNILLTYKKQIAENKLLGPDISYLSGFIDKEDPFQGPTGKIVPSLEEGLKAIDYYHRQGYQQIKLYSAIKPEWVAPLAARAHQWGMRVCGHIPAFMTATQAIHKGYDEITHMNFLFLNFMGDTIDTRTPARFRLAGDKGGKLDLQSKPVQDFVMLLKKKNISLDATLNVWEGMFNEFRGDTNNFLKPIISWLPKEWLQDLAIKSPFGSNDQKPAYSAAFQKMLQFQKILFDKGILLVAGTDGGEANALHHELELYVAAGIPANQALKIATYNAALNCNLQKKYGQVIVGAAADCILIDGDPAKNISDIRRIEWVIKNNRMYQPKQLLQSQGWKYYY